MRICDQCSTENTSQARHCRHCGSSLRQSIELHDPGTVVGPYRIIRLIGKGGFGAVYEAEKLQHPGYRVALKETFNPAYIRSFKTEFDVLCKIHHDCLPHYEAMFEEKGSGYLVMELVPGASLEEVIKQQQGQPLAEAQVMGYAWQLCEVLAFLHSQSPPLFHRDLKPANIRLRQDGLIKLVDFGLLKQGFDQTQSSRMGLSPAYAPLEQWGQTGSHTDHRSDIYSLGATLYHLLTGRIPLTATDRALTKTDPFISPIQHNPRIKPQLSAAIAQAMAIKPEDRYQNIEEFRQALMVGRTTHASPPTIVPTIPAPPIPGHPPVFASDPAHTYLRAKDYHMAVALLEERARSGEQSAAQLLGEMVEMPGVPFKFRSQAATVLASVGDPRPGVCTLPLVMVRIEGGIFVIGNPKEKPERKEKGEFQDEINSRPVRVATFEISRYLITNAQYQLFMDDDGYHPDRIWWDKAARTWLQGVTVKAPRYWNEKTFGKSHPNHPVVGISLYEAVAYCRWLTLTLRDGYIYRLPTEAEWEYVARRDTRRMYVWGNEEPDQERANYDGNHHGTTTVGLFPRGATPDGISDLAGNAWEWTGSIYKPYPYDPNDGREDLSDPAHHRFVLRGGSWSSQLVNLRASSRLNQLPNYPDDRFGFRPVRYLP